MLVDAFDFYINYEVTVTNKTWGSTYNKMVHSNLF